MSAPGLSSRARKLLIAAGAVLGLIAEWAALRPGPLQPAPGAGDYAFAAGDLATGLALIGCGVIGWGRRPQSQIGLLLTASGFAWFAGTFAFSDVRSVAVIGSALATLHRGPLVHAILTYPSGRIRGRVTGAVVGASYAAAAIEPIGQSESGAIFIGLAVAAVAIHRFAIAAGRERRARTAPLVAALAFAFVLVLGAALRLGGEMAGTTRAIAWAYQCVVLAIAVGLTLDLLFGRWTALTVARLVVDLGRRSEIGDLRERLAHALGDRSLEVGYWLPEAAAYVDQAGGRVVLEGHGVDRAVTCVGGEDGPVAVLVHDPAVLGDPELLEAVAAAARIAVSNVRLQAEIRSQVEALQASRRRIVEANDAQRVRLERALRHGVEPRLEAVERLLGESGGDGRGVSVAALLAETRKEVELVREELQSFARGVHPQLLADGGLAPALAELAARTPFDVELTAPAKRMPAAVELALYFVCSEALTNASKHARASRAAIRVSFERRAVLLAVDDDGVGGASSDAGSGLAGLVDRVEALGGTLRIISAEGRGTHLRVELPIT